MSHKTIKQVRSDLKYWGGFWRRRELGEGFASTSVTARICETLRTEVYISSDLHLFSHTSEAIYVPENVKRIGDAINQLTPMCKKAVIDKYKKQKERSDYYIIEAENRLIPLLS